MAIWERKQLGFGHSRAYGMRGGSWVSLFYRYQYHNFMIPKNKNSSRKYHNIMHERERESGGSRRVGSDDESQKKKKVPRRRL